MSAIFGRLAKAEGRGAQVIWSLWSGIARPGGIMTRGVGVQLVT